MRNRPAYQGRHRTRYVGAFAAAKKASSPSARYVDSPSRKVIEAKNQRAVNVGRPGPQRANCAKELELSHRLNRVHSSAVYQPGSILGARSKRGAVVGKVEQCPRHSMIRPFRRAGAGCDNLFVRTSACHAYERKGFCRPGTQCSSREEQP